MKDMVLIAHNVRSTHNVGSLLRTAEGLGITKVYFSGYTPYPIITSDPRLPHLRNKIHRQISKTALGAEKLVASEPVDDLTELIRGLKADGYQICALEQSPDAIPLPGFEPTKSVALIVGNEIEGLNQAVLTQVDTIVEIPMRGKKESFNVVQATAMALYHLTLQVH